MSEARTNALVIRTPEGVSFTLPLAGPVTRFFAFFIDLLVIGALTTLANVLIGFLGIISPDLMSAAMIVMYFVVSIGYGMALEWHWRGQTIGKRVFKLRVVDEGGLRLKFSQIVIRNLLRFVDALPAFYLLGGLACFFSRKSQRLGDYAANTAVIRSRPTFDHVLADVTAGKYNSFRDYPHLEARLRQRVSAEEAALATRVILRRDQLEDERRVELNKELADYFRSVAEFPEEATFGLTDEQYIRNVLDSLYKTKETPKAG